MKNICIQSGHWNMTSGATGAPREQERTIAIGLRLVDLLRANGFNVYHTDAFADDNREITGKDWDLFLALHCDANYAGDEGGGFIDFPDPSVDAASAESKRIKEAIESVYFTESGIRNVPSRSNPNTKFYYMWSALTAKTPCNIIEMGESIDPHDNVILNDVDRVANILLRGIKKAFPDVQPATPSTPATPTQPTVDYKAKYELLLNDYETLKINSFKAVEAVRAEKAKAIDDLTKINEELKKNDIKNFTYGELFAKLKDKKIE